MAGITFRNHAVPFPAGVVTVTLTGTLLGVALTSGQTAPDAVLTINVPVDQATPADFSPVVNFTPGSGYPRPLAIPLGVDGIFTIPPEVQALLGAAVVVQFQVQNAGAATSVTSVQSA